MFGKIRCVVGCLALAEALQGFAGRVTCADGAFGPVCAGLETCWETRDSTTTCVLADWRWLRWVLGFLGVC
jgi:hypothetical protein